MTEYTDVINPSTVVGSSQVKREVSCSARLVAGRRLSVAARPFMIVKRFAMRLTFLAFQLLCLKRKGKPELADICKRFKWCILRVVKNRPKRYWACRYLLFKYCVVVTNRRAKRS